jgi:hypothetical protein
LRPPVVGTYSHAPVTRTRITALLVALLLLAGCEGDDDQGDRPAARRVSGSAELEPPGGGAPDAGTARGHGADVVLGSTSKGSFAFEGRVDPPDSRVTIVNDSTGRPGAVEVEPTGDFTARVTSLRPGLNQFRLRGSKPGHADWTLEVRIVRAARQEAARRPRESELRRGRVEVPVADRTVPEARLRVDRVRGASTIETSNGGPPAQATVPLGEPLRVTAVTRDPNGGAARARVSIRERSSCMNTLTGERATRLTLRYFPPAQIARAKVPPGAVLPRVESRTVRLRFTGERCSGDWIPARVRVTLWADATNAQEMESSSAPVRLMLGGGR